MIETRYRQGYRFVGEVRHASAVPTENDPPEPDPSTPLSSSVAERKVVTLLSCGLARGEGIVDLDTLHSQLLALYVRSA